MNYLLDTHALIWFLEGDPALSEKATGLITNPLVDKYVSIATFWEMAIKVSLGKLTLKQPFPVVIAGIAETPLKILPVKPTHTILVSQLAFHHRDPFDRLFIAQSLSEGMTLVSKDEQFSRYGVTVVW